MIYSQEDNLIIRSMKESDIKNFVNAFEDQNWQKTSELFE